MLENIQEIINEILKNHFLSSARFRSALPHYVTKKEMIEINEQTTMKRLMYWRVKND